MNAYEQLEKHFEQRAYLSHLQSIAHWDEAVMMPRGGGETRAKALSTLQSFSHDLLIDPKIGDLIEQAKQLTLDNPWQAANLRWMEREYLNARALPSELVRRIAESTMRCEQAWRLLRAENNWSDFAPLFEESLTLIKESAHIRAEVFKRSPYDVLIDDFSPGLTQEYIDPIFSHLKKQLTDLIEPIIEKQKSRHAIRMRGPFPIEKQKQLGLDVMQAIGFDFNHGRLDVSHHPFCGGDPTDVRITTRYKENEFLSATFGVCHETGHALYEQGLPQSWLRQPVGRAHNISIHESQSLLIEMQACRSREFMYFLSPLIKRYFGDEEAFTAENLYTLSTTVERGLIRVDADEVTYPLHIILRYELEKKLINGKLDVADLPDAWNDSMNRYLNLSTENNYKDGVMQDVHWPAGILGYFPAYTLGRLTAAQLYSTVLKQHPDLPAQLKRGDFSTLVAWLHQHVHTQASLVNLDELLRHSTGSSLDPKYFIEHIKNRY